MMERSIFLSRKLSLMVMVVCLTGCGINNLPTYDEQVKAAWSEVINQYQRRADLIPALVAVVKSAAAHESEVMEKVVAARARIEQIDSKRTFNDAELQKRYEIEQQNADAALKSLIAYSEAYPMLQANQDFLALVSELEGTENRIALARREYVIAIQIYNTELRTYPGRIWGLLLYRNLKPRENYSAD